MRLKLTIPDYLIALLIVFSFPAQAQPLLNGIAVHEELGNEQFIGALYSETLSDSADTLINSKSAMRMELKVVTPGGLTTRRFSRMWIEGMAINNASSQLTAQADNMVKFDGLFKGRLEANDHIVFAQSPGQGVTVSVNKVLLGTIADDRFFPMLLRTWIGRVPLSSTYRDNLLKVGAINADLRSRYDLIKPSAARVAAITSWTKAAAEPDATQIAAVKEVPKPTTKPVTPIPPPPKVELPTLAQQEGAAEKSQSAKSSAPAIPEPKVVPAKPAAVAVIEEEEEDEPALTAQSLLARQFYVSDLLKKIRSNVTYPRRAMTRGQEGGIRISVALDRNGNIKSMSWLEESRFELLNKEAWEAIKRSAPFPVMPAAIPGSGFEFSAPITFALPK